MPAPKHTYRYWAACTTPGMSGELIGYINDPVRAKKIGYGAFARQVDFDTLPRGRGHHALYRASSPTNWTISYWRSELPSGQRIYFFRWSRIEHIFANTEPDFDREVALLQRAPNPPRVIWSFASGTASPGEIVGHARAGMPPGVAMLRVHDTMSWLCGQSETTGMPLRCWDALIRVSERFDLPVFVDSGAFGEIRSKHTITPKWWRAILRDQLALAQQLGPRAVMVMPDMVGDQTETLRRLGAYRDEVKAIIDAGARAIVVLQPGKRTGAQMAEAVSRVLGRRDWVFGWPTTERANRPPEELEETLEALDWEPAGVHLLGLGPTNPKWDRYMQALSALSPDTWVSADAVASRRLLGRKRGLRPLTREEDAAQAELLDEAWGGVTDELVGDAVDPTEQLPDPSGWLPPSERSRIAKLGVEHGVLDRDEAAAFRRDPTSLLRQVDDAERYGVVAWLEQEISSSWWRQLKKPGGMLSQMRKERGRRRTFGASRALPLAARPIGNREPVQGQRSMFDFDDDE